MIAKTSHTRSQDREAGRPASVDGDGVVLTPEHKRAQRARSIAIGVALGGLVVLFYVITVLKLGVSVLDRPL